MLLIHQGKDFKNTLSSFYSIVKNFGAYKLYDGLTIICFRNIVGSLLFYGTRDILSESIKYQFEFEQKLSTDLTTGLFGGVLVSVFTHPIKLLQYNYQSKIILTNKSQKNLYSMMKSIIKDRGYIKGLYRGYWPSLFRTSFT